MKRVIKFIGLKVGEVGLSILAFHYGSVGFRIWFPEENYWLAGCMSILFIIGAVCTFALLFIIFCILIPEWIKKNWEWSK